MHTLSHGQVHHVAVGSIEHTHSRRTHVTHPHSVAAYTTYGLVQHGAIGGTHSRRTYHSHAHTLDVPH